MNGIILDLDDTLIIIDDDSYIPQPDLYLVMYGLYNLPDTKLLLWTHSTIDRTKKILKELKIEIFFEKIFTRLDCERSKAMYGYLKSFHYLKKKMPDIKFFYAIDDLADTNMDDGYVYSHVLKPRESLSNAASEIVKEIISLPAS